MIRGKIEWVYEADCELRGKMLYDATEVILKEKTLNLGNNKSNKRAYWQFEEVDGKQCRLTDIESFNLYQAKHVRLTFYNKKFVWVMYKSC